MNVCIGTFYNYQGSKHHLLNNPYTYSKWTKKMIHVAIIHLYIVYCCIYALMQRCTDAWMYWCINALRQSCTDVLMHWCTDALMHWCTDALMHWCTDALMQRCTDALNLRPLSVFFKILQISNTGTSAADILATIGAVSFLYPKHSPFFDREYYFQQLAYHDSQVPQALFRINSNAMFSLFWWQLGHMKWPHCMLASATHVISGFTAREMSQLPTRLLGQCHCISKLLGRWGGFAPLKYPLTGWQPMPDIWNKLWPKNHQIS